MLIAHCDKCENVETIRTGFVNPKDWGDITVSGNIPTKERGISRQLFKMLLCGTCIATIFNVEAEPKQTVEQMFKDAAADYLSELAYEALDDAAENQ